MKKRGLAQILQLFTTYAIDEKLIYSKYYSITAMLNEPYQTSFGSVIKRSLSAHRMQVKLFFVTFNLNCRLHAVPVGKPSERM